MSFLAFVPTANAGIKCQDEFQVIKGEGLLATPWCEDEYLARVARQYGRKVSGRMMRQNPNLKDEVCRHIGHDHRVKTICEDNGGFDEPSTDTQSPS